MNEIIIETIGISKSFHDPIKVQVLKDINFKISKGELSAFFRLKGHKNYRECGDQIIRNFLQGLTIHFRNSTE